MAVEITDQHRAALHQLLSEPQIGPASIRRLRDRFGEEAGRRLGSVAELQGKARQKFGPGVWWVTARGLQQATAWQVGDLKASWFGHEAVFDLCCGVGGDLVRLARRGPVIGVDSDREIAAMAAMNLQETAASTRGAVKWGEALQTARPSGAAIHVDPDRRPGIGRTTAANRFDPPWAELEPVLDRSGDAIAKLAPATRLEGASVARVHRCWIALGSTVREQSVLFGETIHRAGLAPGTRSAIILRADGQCECFAPAAAGVTGGAASRRNSMVEPMDVDINSVAAGGVPAPGSVLVDPHAAIRAAGLTEAFASVHQFRVVGGPSGFLNADDPRELGGLATAERVLWSGACDDRGLRRQLRRRDARPVTVKTRGVDLDPAALVKRYRRCGDQPVALWIGRVADRVYAAITTGSESPSPPPSAERDSRADPRSPGATPPLQR